MEDSQEQIENSKPWLYKKGQSGNPGGRPKGSKSMKTWLREKFEIMTDEERETFLEGLPKLDLIKLAEGNPHSTADNKVEVNVPTPLLNVLNNNSNQEDSESK